MAYRTLEPELKKLGLSDKEAAVYLAALALGPTTVQQISRRARVARATTYLVLESLVGMGLVTQYTEAGKTMYVAEHPRQLDELLSRRVGEVTEQRGRLVDLLPKLEALVRLQDDRPVVRYYEGIEGLRAMQSELVRHGTRDGDISYNLSPLDDLVTMFGAEDFLYTRPRKARGLRARSLFTTRSEKRKKDFLASAPAQLAERRFVPAAEYTSGSALSIYEDWVAIGTLRGRQGGVIIEGESTAAMMRELFEMAWKSY